MRWPRIRPKAKLKPPNRTPALPTYCGLLCTRLARAKRVGRRLPAAEERRRRRCCTARNPRSCAQRAKHSKTDAPDIALRTKEILDLIPDGSDISTSTDAAEH
ncbi:hypothetical protein C8J57DRAFT_1544107 [Mycena rebaudengoi]|nr:hypothetical protein C8J57DRAFT_1544107 [Mycena rebaudengoi]